jgi:D-aminopeptidase
VTDPLRSTPAGKPRARTLGIEPRGVPGPWNAITDVAGVEVGHRTLIQGRGVRTGVTAILPRGRERPLDPCAAGVFSLNGNGEMTGVSWIEESGTLALPVTITNTHAIGSAHEGTVRWTVEHAPDAADLWLLPVAAETYDGYLNEINGGHVTRDDAVAAIEAACSGPVEEGSVGGGTGMNCYGFKGGAGTASRRVEVVGAEHTVGVHLQCNFGSRHELVIAGVPLGEVLADDDPLGDYDRGSDGMGSVIGIVATDAPLLPGQCKALARRVPLGLARTGTSGSHFSGDLFLAFSTANPGAFATGFPPERAAAGDTGTLRFLQWRQMDALYQATVEAVEEAVLNALCANDEMIGRLGHRTPALPRDRVAELLARRVSPAAG